jgi:hypothetical protein
LLFLAWKELCRMNCANRTRTKGLNKKGKTAAAILTNMPIITKVGKPMVL